MVVLQHEHSMCLVDLNPNYPHDEQAYDDEEDLIIKQAFQSPCNRCRTKITCFHRYYYNCDQCGYLLHKLCVEFPTRLEHASHSAHTLTLFLDESQEQCYMCKSVPRFNQLCYHCSQCSFNICLDCGMNKVQYHSLYHPSHKHPLIPLYRHKEILAECEACGKEHKGVFYHCATCLLCFIHNDCVFQPKRFLIQNGTLGQFFHTHHLILTYSFPKIDQEARFNPTCRVCDNSFIGYENLWVYKCDKCRYYVHLHCASLRCEPSGHSAPRNFKRQVIPWLIGTDITSNNYEDEPNVVHLPLPDRTYNIIKDFFHKNTKETSITHASHEHPLILVDTRGNDITILVNNDENLCNGCVRPIMDMRSYKCSYGCNFVLHEWCTRLPTEIYHSGTRHTLILLPKEPYIFLGLFYCDACGRHCNGFAYSFVKRDRCYRDVSCAFIPEQITHISHPYHLLKKVLSRSLKNHCRMCLLEFTHGEISYSCGTCNFHLHLACALSLPMTIRHKYDKHPMTLTYSPVQNHDGDYFCEVCEEELNPYISFYHCHVCAQSIHSTCAPLIPQSKPYLSGLSSKEYSSRYKNIKFGSIHKTDDHPHPLAFLQATESDGHCTKCGKILKGNIGLFLKCLQCEFAIHLHCSINRPK